MVRHYDVITIGETTLDAFMSIHDSSSKVHLDNESGELRFKHGEKINVERYDFSMGGNATNVAVGLSRLGIKATVCSEIGDDEFSIKIRNMLAIEGVERLFVTQAKNSPSNFSVIINFKGERTIFAQHLPRKNDFHLDEVTAAYIYLTSVGTEWEDPYKMVLKFVSEQKCKLVFNPGNLQLREGKDVVHEVLKNTEILFVNKEEAELLLFNHYNKKIDNSDNYVKNLCEELSLLGPKIVAITNGRHGSAALDKDGNFYTQDLFPEKVVERTGAGDGFASGFLSAIIYGENVQKALIWGTHNGGSVVGKVGAEAGLLTKEQMDAKL